MYLIVFYIMVNVGLKSSSGPTPSLGIALQSGSLASNFQTECMDLDKHILERKTVNNILHISLNMSRDWWFPAMWHFDMCILRRACAASCPA